MEQPEEIVRRYGDMVYRLAYARTRSRSDADDIFQEVFLRYFRIPRRFESEEHRKAWLLRVTANCGNSFWSSSRPNSPLPEELPCPTPEESGLEEAMQALPPTYRTVIHLYYYEGYSTEEIGRLLHRASSTVRTQLTRARRQLSHLLKGDQ